MASSLQHQYQASSPAKPGLDFPCRDHSGWAFQHRPILALLINYYWIAVKDMDSLVNGETHVNLP